MRFGRKNFTFGQRAGYRALRAVFYPLSLLPLRALYLISDGQDLLPRDDGKGAPQNRA